MKTSTNWRRKIFATFIDAARKGKFGVSCSSFLDSSLVEPLGRITVQMDDDMVKHYSHEDTVLLEVHQIDTETHDITLVEYDPC